MPNYTEIHVKNAENDVLQGKSIRKAAADWGIPYATLSRRLKGATTVRKSKEDFQRLSKSQEKSLAQWAIIQGSLGFAPSHTQVREFASRIVRKGGDQRPLADTDVLRAPPWDPMLPEVPQTPQDAHIVTPKKSGDLRRYRKLWEVRGEVDDFDSVSRKLIFDKVGKQLDAQNFALAATQRTIQSLEAQVALYKPVSRAKVRQDPNERFVQIETIMRTKKEVAARPQRQITESTTVPGISEAAFASMCSEFQL
ncbi:hypothetical protein CSAL01_09169 [Colletotrichum salicis]|uniref:HTH psq-type domain-containing protein n=1 Tax=Colletotrichum salicis TaxID=1209931 RepID=A0A135S4Z1_9PEZI|nr:hypothetical protein CSAL01_09169 [Colletotrichum salicis]